MFYACTYLKSILNVYVSACSGKIDASSGCLYFTDTLWPDFTNEDLDEAIESFNNRDRRFGAVKK